MAEKALPKEGAQAIMDAWSDANEAIINQKKKKPKETVTNEEFREFVKPKKK